jgi:two-component system, sensor histidine kinase
MKTARIAPGVKLIVIIDDDPVILDAMSGLLRGWGYRVLTAASGDAALARLAELGEQPDFIICDYQLAGEKYGTQAIAQLCHEYDVPAVLMTGAVVPLIGPSEDPIRYEVLHKPVDVTILQSMLISALGR